jgi:hypothetical protein
MVASCSLFLYDLNYEARKHAHKTQVKFFAVHNYLVGLLARIAALTL